MATNNSSVIDSPLCRHLPGRGPAVPIALHEAAIDSPTFRASAAHFADQVDALERWLDGYAKATSRLVHDMLNVEESIHSYLAKVTPSPTTSDSVLDQDYTLLALRRAGDASRDWWMQILSAVKKTETVSVNPIRSFIAGDLRNFKEARRTLDATQRTFDATLARYLGQSKTKEPSALREDAFSVYETRRAYLRAAMDFCQLAPQLRFTLDKVLVRASSDLWRTVKNAREVPPGHIQNGFEIERIRSWSKEMEASEPAFRRELQAARRDIGDGAVNALRPSKNLEDYSAFTVSFLGSRGPVSRPSPDTGAGPVAVVSERQGWLFFKSLGGKPVRAHWIRRWFYCREGIFGWLVQGPQGVVQGEEIGVLLCNAKPAVSEERRFCFEVKTKNQSLVLQAETQAELTEWLEVFEVAKKRAFETSMARDNASLPPGIDPAFSITPPSIPEFSAKSLDSQLAAGEDGTPSGLSGATPDMGLTARASFDVTGGIPRRSITALGRDLAREDGESSREHAARIIQKLDLGRKTATFGPGAEIAPPSGQGGIASLVSASYNLLPTTYAARPPPSATLTSFEPAPGSLAPSTLSRPPLPTPLSRVAVAVTADRSLSSEAARSVSTAVTSNYWGSDSWGVRLYSPGSAAADITTGILDIPVGQRGDQGQRPTRPTHRKTLSAGPQLTPPASDKPALETFPAGYPAELRSQHAQFRLLFPHAPLSEKLVLVFPASWLRASKADVNTKGNPIGNGRIYVTTENMYLYSQDMGMIITFSIRLDTITEVTALAGRDSDAIVLQLTEDDNDDDLNRITINSFIGDMHILQSRLNLLIDDLQAEEPMELPELIRQLVDLENETQERRSPSIGSWEEIHSGASAEGRSADSRRAPMDSKDVGLGLQMGGRGHGARPNIKFRLPSHPVIYIPEDMERKASERHFEISAKACFHVMFGDKSFIFPRLYFDKRAQNVTQCPWNLSNHGKMKREFQYDVASTDLLGRSKIIHLTDVQTVDVYREHVTYVVTLSNTAWHLPHSQYFKAMAKVVITHVAKSKCKLAIFINVTWSKSPALSKKLVERQALDDLTSQAEELAEAATHQVRRLGPHSRTKQAIQAYGHIGQQTESVTYSPSDVDADDAKGQTIKLRTLTEMVFETVRSFAESAVTSVLMWSFAAVRSIFKILNANRLILILLGLSILTNAFLTSRENSTWWAERRATRFMRRIGVGPNTMMSKAVYLVDLEEAANPSAGPSALHELDSPCYNTFQAIANSTDIDTPAEEAGPAFSTASSRATAQRLRRSRQRLGSYRHDLLVAMRVVNSIERAMIVSEWENWLTEENFRCDQLQTLLRTDRDAFSSADKDGPELGDESLTGREQRVVRPRSAAQKAKLAEWYAGYCGSCRADQRVLAEDKKLTA